MGPHANGRLHNLLAWLTVALVVALSSTYLVVTVAGLLGAGG